MEAAMHQPTHRVLDILEFVAKNPEPLRLTDFSRELDIPKSTLLPMLQTLCGKKYLFQDLRGNYTAGTALFSMASAFSGCFPLLDYLRQELTQLVDRFQETCYCGALEQGDVLYLCKVDSPQPLRVLTDTGRRMPAYSTSLGKALLTDHSLPRLAGLYPHGLQAVTEATVTDLQTLHAQLQQARVDGYAWEIEESTRHVRCFAVPVRKHKTIVAAISIAIPCFRYEESRQQELIEALQQTALRIGHTMEQTDAHFGELF